jgi:hypothetical protein
MYYILKIYSENYYEIEEIEEISDEKLLILISHNPKYMEFLVNLGKYFSKHIRNYKLNKIFEKI